MNLDSKNITFVIVTFKSEKIVYECINSLPKNSNNFFTFICHNNKSDIFEIQIH